MDQLMAAEAAVTSNQDALAAAGVTVVQRGPNVATNRLDVSVVNAPVGAAQMVDQFVSDPGEVNVSSISPDEVPIFTVDRMDDTAPYNGGDGVYSVQGSLRYSCSSGFGVEVGSATRLLGAGHCFDQGWSLKNGACYVSGSPCTGSGASMGTAVSVDRTSGSIDTALWATSGAAAIWTNDTGSLASTAVNGWMGPQVGTMVCNSGASSGEVCDIQVTALDQCASGALPSGASITYCGMATGVSTTSGIANQDGDSGGPILQRENGKLYAALQVSP